MAAPAYITQGGAVTVSTAAAPAYPTGITAGDLLVLYVSSDSASIPLTQSGWTNIGGVRTGGGLSSTAWVRTATGSETGTHTISGITGGTKGLAWIGLYRPAAAGNTITASTALGADTDSTSTAYTATAAALTTAVDDRLVALTTVLTTGTFSANASSPTLTQAGATLTATARFAGRSFTNTVYYGQVDAAVTTGSTGAPSLTATTAGGNGTGQTLFVLLHENAPAPTDTANAGADQSVPAWATVSVTGTGSAVGSWSVVSGNATLTGSGATRTFTAVPSDAFGGTATVVLRYTVGTASDDVTVTIGAASILHNIGGVWKAGRDVTFL